MDKYAAEKLAEEYYLAGVKLALAKEAGLPKEIVKKMVQAPVAGIGGIAALATLIDSIESHGGDALIALKGLGLIAGTGAGAMLGAAGAGKAVDLAHSGGSKLLNKLRR